MESKEEIVRKMSREPFLILNKHARLWAMPVGFDEGAKATHREPRAIQAIEENRQINITDLGWGHISASPRALRRRWPPNW